MASRHAREMAPRIGPGVRYNDVAERCRPGHECEAVSGQAKEIEISRSHGASAISLSMCKAVCVGRGVSDINERESVSKI
jgi:hypothetical protein